MSAASSSTWPAAPSLAAVYRCRTRPAGMMAAFGCSNRAPGSCKSWTSPAASRTMRWPSCLGSRAGWPSSGRMPSWACRKSGKAAPSGTCPSPRRGLSCNAASGWSMFAPDSWPSSCSSRPGSRKSSRWRVLPGYRFSGNPRLSAGHYPGGFCHSRPLTRGCEQAWPAALNTLSRGATARLPGCSLGRLSTATAAKYGLGMGYRRGDSHHFCGSTLP